MNQITVRWSLSEGVVGYGAALPDGRYAVLLNDAKIQTREGLIPQPPGGPLMYLDLAPDGQIAGCGHNGDRVWKGDGDTWTDPEWAWGPYACVFRPDSSLVTFPDRASWSETGGWRYSRPDGSLVPATQPIIASYADPARGLYGFTEWPDVAIGQGGKNIGQGCVVRFADDGILRRLAFKDLRAVGELRFVVVKRAGDLFAITVVDFQTASTTLTWATLAELRAMPPVVAVPPPVTLPTFRFTHPVILAPFAAAGSGLPDLFDLRADGRVLFIHDGEQDWTIPVSDLPPSALVLWELYLVPGETLSQFAARGLRQSRSYLAQWPGDCGVVPMFYDQDRWTIGQVLDVIGCLPEVVNLSDRIKVIAPFAYNRANGIVKYPELQATLGNLNTEAQRVGRAELTPISAPPTPPPPPKPPTPPVPPLPPPVSQGDTLMQFSTLDSAKVVPYKTLKPSSQSGCVTVILPDDRVLSALGDDRDPGTDGPWEQAQVVGNEATFLADGKYHTWLIVPVDKIPR